MRSQGNQVPGYKERQHNSYFRPFISAVTMIISTNLHFKKKLHQALNRSKDSLGQWDSLDQQDHQGKQERRDKETQAQGERQERQERQGQRAPMVVIMEEEEEEENVDQSHELPHRLETEELPTNQGEEAAAAQALVHLLYQSRF